MNGKLLVIGIVLCFFMAPFAGAADLDFSIEITGKDVSLVKSYTQYQGSMNHSVTQYERYIYAVDQLAFNYNSEGFIGDNHDIAVSTNLTGTRSPSSGISGSEYIENIGSCTNKTGCVFGIHGSGRDLVVASIVGITPLSLDYGYAIEARNGEAGAGYTKFTNNVSTTSRYNIRGKEVTIIGQQTCTRYPADVARIVEEEEKSLKEQLCVWGQGGGGFPLFYPRYTLRNETRQVYTT
ncbi:MAG: hypothetical protein ACNYVW_00470 [Methanosarcinales archaeon]